MINIDKLNEFKHSYIAKVKDVLTFDQEIALDDFISFIEANDTISAHQIKNAIKAKLYDMHEAKNTEEFYKAYDDVAPLMEVLKRFL